MFIDVLIIFFDLSSLFIDVLIIDVLIKTATEKKKMAINENSICNQNDNHHFPLQ